MSARPHRPWYGRALRLAGALLLLAGAAQGADTRSWPPLRKDGIHDPRSPAMELLQEPREALAPLPPDTAGNQVRWVEALEQGVINPRTNIRPETNVRVLETTIDLNVGGSVPVVRFPHRAHTLWLDCDNCHEKLFRAKKGATRISKFAILSGNQCGLCHGAVAFPLTECTRCHNTPQSAARRAAAAKP